MTIDRNRRISVTACLALAIAAGAASAQNVPQPQPRPTDPQGVNNPENRSASDWYSQSAGTAQYVQPSRGEHGFTQSGRQGQDTTIHHERTTTEFQPQDQNRIYGVQEQRFQSAGWQSAQTLPQIGSNDLVLVGEKNNKTTEVVFDDGQLVSYTLDGRTMPLNKVQAQGNRIRVLDENNQVCATFDLPQSITSGRFGTGQTYTQTYNERRFGTNEPPMRDQDMRDRDWRTESYQQDRNYDRTYNQSDRTYSQQYQENREPSSSFDRFYGDRQQSYSPSRSPQNYGDTYTRDTYREQSYPRDQYTRDQMYDRNADRVRTTDQDTYRQERYRGSMDRADNRVWNPQTQSYEYRATDNRVWNPQTQSWEYRSFETRSYQDRGNQDRMYDRNRDQQRTETFQQNRIYGTTGANKPMVLGIMMEDADQSQINSTQYQQGVKVTSVQTGLPADTAGLKQNDIIVMVDNQPATVSLVRQTLTTKHEGDQVHLTVLRDNQPKDITVKLTTVDRKMYNWDYMGDIQKSDEFTDTNIENLGHPGPHNNYRPTQPEPNYGDQPKSGNRPKDYDNR
jgi:hypothetical protein